MLGVVAQAFDHVGKVLRQFRAEFHSPAVARVVERQAGRVQERAIQRLDGAQLRRDAAMDAAVERVADDRMADAAQVDADLMGAAGGDADADQAHAGERLLFRGP